MPKIVFMDKAVVKGVTIRNFMAGGKDVVDVDVWEGEDVTQFSYRNLPEKKIETITGTLRKVNMSFINKTPKPTGKKYSITDMAQVDSIEVDTSTLWKSNVVTIKKEDILEYNHGGTADDATAFPLLKLKLHLILSNKKEQDVEIEEGDQFSALIYSTSPAPSIVINNFKVTGFVYTSSFDVTGLVLNNGTEDVEVPLTSIKIFGNEAEMIEDIGEVKDAINESENSEEPTIVVINAPGKVSEGELKLGHVVQISGVKAGIPANKGDRANNTVDEKTENIISSVVNTFNDAEVHLDGLTFTDKATIDLSNAKSFELENSKFVNIASGVSDGRTYLFTTKSKTWDNLGNADPILVNIEGCYFGKHPDEGQGIPYNGLELIQPLADGSTISNNTFHGPVTHNYLNIYHVKDNSTINIENNHIDEATAFIRIALVGSPQNVTINFKNNKYDAAAMDENDGNDGYGLVLIQPHTGEKFKTVDLSGVRINIDGTTPIDDEKLYSIYLSANDTLEKEQYPQIYINGVKQTKYHVFDKRAKV